VSRILTYNGPGNQIDKCTAIAQDVTGKVYATGVSFGGSSTREDIATIKFSEDGDFLWVRRYDGTGHNLDYANAMTLDKYANVYVTGWSRWGAGQETEDIVTIKYDANGNLQWVARYDGTVGDCHQYDHGHAIVVDEGGNVYVTGLSHGNNNIHEDYITLKYSPSGVLLWDRRYNSPSNNVDAAWSISLDGVGGVYITGESYLNSKGLDMVTIKYNTAGTQQWLARYNNNSANGDDRGCEVVTDRLGNSFVTGSSYNGTTGKLDYYTIKYNTAGTEQWAKRYNGSGNDTDAATGIDIDVHGNVYVTGYSKGTGSANYDYTTIKYSGIDGSQMWLNTYNGGSVDKAWDVKVFKKSCAADMWEEGDIPCWDIAIYVTGQSTGIGTSNDFLNIRYSEVGVQSWVNRFNGPTNSSDAAYSIAINDGHPIIYAGGSFANDYGIIGITEERPGDFIQNGSSKSYPNPFNPETRISFRIEKESNVKLVIFDILGRTVATLIDKKLSDGTHGVTWNAANLNSGVYFYRLETDFYTETKKLVLIK
jgi:hypothetical protein